MKILIVTVLAYYISVLAVSLFRFRKQTASEYITAPNATGFVALTLTLVATIVGGGMFIGITQQGFDQPLTVAALGISYMIGSFIMGLLAPTFRRIAKERGATTLLGLFQTMYPSNSYFSASTLLGIMSFVVFFLMLAVQFVAIGVFLSFYGRIGFAYSILYGAAIVAILATLFYASFGGFKRDIFTDVVQMIFIALGVGIILFQLTTTDFHGKMSSLPLELFTISGRNIVFFLGSLLFVPLTFLVRFDLWQRVITAKSDRQAKAAFFTSGFLALVFFVAFGLIGLYGRADSIADKQFAGLEVIQRLVTGQFAYGLVVASFFAAVMSSADTFLGVAGLALARSSNYRKDELERPDERKVSVRRLRIMTGMVGIASYAIAYVMQDILDLFASAFGILLIFLPAFIGGLLRETPSIPAAKASIVVGLLIVLPSSFILPREAFLPGLLASTVTYLIVNKSTRGAKVVSVL